MKRRTLLRSAAGLSAAGGLPGTVHGTGAAGGRDRNREVCTASTDEGFESVPFREGERDPWNGQAPEPQYQGDRQSEKWVAWAKRLPERNSDAHDGADAPVAPRTFNTYGWTTVEDGDTTGMFGEWTSYFRSPIEFEVDFGNVARKGRFDGLDRETYTAEINFDVRAEVPVAAECTCETVPCEGPGEESRVTLAEVEVPDRETTVEVRDDDASVVVSDGASVEIVGDTVIYDVEADGAEFSVTGDDAAAITLTGTSVTTRRRDSPGDGDDDPGDDTPGGGGRRRTTASSGGDRPAAGTITVESGAETVGLDERAEVVVSTEPVTYTLAGASFHADTGGIDTRSEAVTIAVDDPDTVTETVPRNVRLYTTAMSGFLEDFDGVTVYDEEFVDPCSKRGSANDQALPDPPFDLFTLRVGDRSKTWRAKQLYFTQSPDPPYPDRVPMPEVKETIRDFLTGVDDCGPPIERTEDYLDGFERVVFELDPPDNAGATWLQAELPPSAIEGDGPETGVVEMDVEVHEPLQLTEVRVHDVFVELAAPPVVGAHGWSLEWDPSEPSTPVSIGPLKENLEQALRRDLGQYPWVWAKEDRQQGQWAGRAADHPFVFFHYDRKQDISNSASKLRSEIGETAVLGSFEGKVWAHGQSMGGLVWRTYLKQWNGTDRVEKLTMSGTPNLGSRLADLYVYGNDWYQYWTQDAYYTDSNGDLEPTDGIVGYRHEGRPWWDTGARDSDTHRDHLADFQIKPVAHNGFMDEIATRRLAMDREQYFTVVGDVAEIPEPDSRQKAFQYVKEKAEAGDAVSLDDGVVAARSVSIDGILDQRTVSGSHTTVPGKPETGRLVGRFYAGLDLDTGRPVEGTGGSVTDARDRGGNTAPDGTGVGPPSIREGRSGVDRLAAGQDPAVQAGDAGVVGPGEGVQLEVGEDERVATVLVLTRAGERRHRTTVERPDGTTLDPDSLPGDVEFVRASAWGSTVDAYRVDRPEGGTWTVRVSARKDATLEADERIRVLVGRAATITEAPVRAEAGGETADTGLGLPGFGVAGGIAGLGGAVALKRWLDRDGG